MATAHWPADVVTPALAMIEVPAHWRQVDFISDLHLTDAMPQTFAAWRDYLLRTTADAVFILGDLFEAWVGDDSRHAGFEAQACSVLTRSAARQDVFVMVGNRDFLLGDAMLRACGLHALADPTVLSAFGGRALLTHGDAWCTSDVDYQRFRARVRAPAWQAQVLEQPLAERRKMARSMRSESERLASDQKADQRADQNVDPKADPKAPWHDIDPTIAREAMVGAGASILVHGHTHRPGSDTIHPGGTRHVLSDWDLDHGTQHRAEVLRWDAEGWHRLSPRAAVAAVSLS